VLLLLDLLCLTNESLHLLGGKSLGCAQQRSHLMTMRTLLVLHNCTADWSLCCRHNAKDSENPGRVRHSLAHKDRSWGQRKLFPSRTRDMVPSPHAHSQMSPLNFSFSMRANVAQRGVGKKSSPSRSANRFVVGLMMILKRIRNDRSWNVRSLI
jgi:hypothetical protein